MKQHTLIAGLLWLLASPPFGAAASNPSPIDIAQTQAGPVDISDRSVALRNTTGAPSLPEAIAHDSAKDAVALKSANRPFELHPGQLGGQPLAAYLDLLEDPDGKLSIDQVRQADVAARFATNPKPQEVPNFSYTRSAIWVRLTLTNPGDTAVDRLLEFSHNYVDEVILHQPDQNGDYRATVTGRGHPFASRPYPSRYFVFPLHLAAGESRTLYLELRSHGSIVVPLKLWDADSYGEFEKQSYTVQGLFFGTVIALSLFNALLSLILRDTIYLLYVCYVLALGLVQAATQGLGQQFLWPEASVWSTHAVWTFSCVGNAFIILFSRRMLDTPTIAPRMDRFLRAYIGICLTLLVLEVLVPSPLVSRIMNANVALLALACISVATIAARQRQRAAYFWFASFVPLVIGVIVEQLMRNQLLPFNLLTSSAIQFGSAIEMVMFSLGLADRFAQMRREKEQAQQAMVDRLRASEERSKQMFRAIPDYVAITSFPEGRFVEVNPGFERLTGYSREEAIDQTLVDLNIFADPAQGDAYIDEIQKKSVVHDFDARALRKNGQLRDVTASGAIFEVGNAAFLVTIARDVTDEHQRDIELRETLAAKQAAETANKMKSEFLATISHEVRTPLGGVIGMIKFGLRDRGLQTATREKLDLGLANAESLLQIINDILDYSKLEAGKMTLELIDFDLPKLVRDTVAMLAERAESKGISLVYEIEADFPQWWHGDPTRLRQVLVNLAGNSIKFTEEGEVRIAVETTSEGMLITVRDTGIGIAADALPRLFQKFEQADASTARRFGGTGLGLAICKQIVEAMGGRITVKSTLGLGTSFCMTLPLPRGKPVVGSEADRAAEHQYRLNILCAEDGMTNQVILRELVTGMGHTFTLAEDGEAALVALSQADYDLLLLDSRMPKLDGLDVLKALRAGERNVRQPQLAVIAVTANAGKEERERFMAAGAQGFLPKPIDEHALQAEIGRVIEWLLERDHVLPVIESTTAEPSPQLDAGNTALAAPGAMSASPAMRQAFLTEGPRLLGELRKALDAGDGATAARSAHSLKGMAGYFAAPDLQEHARLAEHAADAGNLDEAREQLAYMQASVERVLAVLGGEAVTSTAPSPANATQTLSQDELNTLLATLEQQLARSSLDAETTLATLRDGLAAGEAAELAAQMARQLESFDFSAAKTTLAMVHGLLNASS